VPQNLVLIPPLRGGLISHTRAVHGGCQLEIQYTWSVTH